MVAPNEAFTSQEGVVRRVRARLEEAAARAGGSRVATVRSELAFERDGAFRRDVEILRARLARARALFGHLGDVDFGDDLAGAAERSAPAIAVIAREPVARSAPLVEGPGVV